MHSPSIICAHPFLLGATESVALPANYVQKNNELAARQLVLAAYRLAETIKMIFGAKNAEEVAQEEPKSTFLQ